MPCLSDCASTHSRISSFSRSFKVCSFLSDVGLPVLIVSFQYFYNFLTAAVLSGKPILLSSSKVFMLTSYVVQKWHLSLRFRVTSPPMLGRYNPRPASLSPALSGRGGSSLCVRAIELCGVYIQFCFCGASGRLFWWLFMRLYRYLYINNLCLSNRCPRIAICYCAYT